MNTELMQSYRAVHCARCNEPIPVSTKVAGLFDEIEHSETMLPYAFTARCVLCECESVYAIGDIREATAFGACRPEAVIRVHAIDFR